MAAEKAPIESIITVELVPEDGPDVFRSVSGLHDQKNARSVFGGILISHAIGAASQTSIMHWSTKQDFPVHDRNYLKYREPCDWRPCEFTVVDEPTEFRMYGFVRSPEISTDSPGMHMAAIGYISDSNIIGPSLYANMSKVGRMIENVAMAVSLNHSVVFHDFDARADQWMVCERKSSWGGDGRVLTHQRIWYVETGCLVISCTQEGIARIKDASFKL